MVQRDGNIQHIRVFVGSHRWGHFCKRDHSNGGTQLSCFKGEGCIVGCDASRFDNFKVSEFRRPNRKPDILESGASIAGVSQRFVATDDKNDFHHICRSLDLEDGFNDCRNLDFGRRQSKEHTNFQSFLQKLYSEVHGWLYWSEIAHGRHEHCICAGRGLFVASMAPSR